MLNRIKNHPGMIVFVLSLASAEYWVSQITENSTLSDQIFNALTAPLMMVVTMFPCGGVVCLFWALMGWWDEP